MTAGQVCGRTSDLGARKIARKSGIALAPHPAPHRYQAMQMQTGGAPSSCFLSYFIFCFVLTPISPFLILFFFFFSFFLVFFDTFAPA